MPASELGTPAKFQSEKDRDTFIHELLHDAFRSVMKPDEQARIGAAFNKLFNPPTDSERRQSLFYPLPYMLADSFQKEINSFIETRFANADPATKSDIRKALEWYCDTRSQIESKAVQPEYALGPDSRERFMNTEVFAYLFQFKAIPWFLRSQYANFLSPSALEQAAYPKPSSYLFSYRALDSFIPIAQDFVSYLEKAKFHRMDR